MPFVLFFFAHVRLEGYLEIFSALSSEAALRLSA
jgi:hypothetical protein